MFATKSEHAYTIGIKKSEKLNMAYYSEDWFKSCLKWGIYHSQRRSLCRNGEGEGDGGGDDRFRMRFRAFEY